MADTSAFTSIRAIVNKARQRGNISEQRDASLYSACIEGMKQLSLFNLPQKKSEPVSFDSLGRVKFPEDLLKFLSLSIPKGGREFVFTKDRAMVTTSTHTYSYDIFDKNYGEGEEIKDNFSITYVKGSGSEIYFNLNERLRYAQVSGFQGSKATLNYLSTGVSENAEGVVVPKICENALIAYCLWRDSEYDTSLSIGERQFREQKYYNECDDLDSLNYLPTKEEIMDEYYSHLYQSIKRL